MKRLGMGLTWMTLSLIGCTHQKAVGQPRLSECEVRRDMRTLWGEHVSWTRFYLISAVAGLQDKSETEQRLLQNQTDIGNAMKPYYGETAGQQLTALLRDHILIAGELIDAGKAGAERKKANATKRWHANADEIAAFLSGANPEFWPLARMQKELHSHLDLAAAEFSAHIQKDWRGDIAAYDSLHQQILEMADMLGMGIVSQFPEKFNET